MQEERLQATYCNIKEVIEQQHYIFDNLWNKSIVANEKIREIEEGIESEFYDIIMIMKKQRTYLLICKVNREGIVLLLFAR